MEFGPYQLLEKLAEGGVGEVYLARRSGGELVVLKKLRPMMKENQMAGPRLVREAHVVSSLSHPNIARVFDAGFVGNTFYLTSELIRGATLGVMIRSSGAPPPEIAVSIIRSVLDALEHAHDSEDGEGRKLGLVHRDVSTGNIMIDREGVVKLIDFGIAHARIDRPLTEPGVVIGTPAYMTPEQVLAEPVDARTDLYSAGAVLYEALNGAPAVTSGSLSEMLKAIVKQRPAPFCTEASKALESVVFRAMAKDPADRWQTAADFRGALMATPEGRRAASTHEVARWIADRLPEEMDHGPTMVRTPEEHLPTRTEISPLVEPLIEPAPRAKSTMLSAVVLVALAMIALVGVVLVSREPSRARAIDPPVTPIEAAQPSVSERSDPEPPPSPREPAPPPAPQPPAPVRPRIAKVIPATAPRSSTVEEDAIHRMLRELEGEADHKLFLKLSQALEAEANALPPDQKKVIVEHLARADITLDVSALKSAVQALDSFRR